MRKALLLLVVLAGFFAGCENKYKDPDPQAMGYDYYPLEVGNYRVYDVTDIKFRENEAETLRFQLRERVDTSFHDQTNQLVYKIVRSTRLRENSGWLDDSVMVVSKTNTMVLLTKDNTKYVKLVFPVKEGKEWVGDIYNDRVAGTDRNNKVREGKEVYNYANLGVPHEIGGSSYPNTVTVVQSSSTNLTTRLDEREEVYAEGVGLVYRLFNRVIYAPCFDNQCEKGPGYKLQGHERHEVLVSHGKM